MRLPRVWKADGPGRSAQEDTTGYGKNFMKSLRGIRRTAALLQFRPIGGTLP